MKIVFFEVHDWEEEVLRKNFPDALLTEKKLTAETASRFKDVEIISCFIYSAIDKKVVDTLPLLRFIATRSTGFDHIDSSYCKTKHITISNVPEYGSNTVAEHTFGLILSLTRKIYQSVNQTKRLNFNHAKIRGVDLFGKTIGIVGTGKIGEHVLRIAFGFGMKVLAFDVFKRKDLLKQFPFQYVPFEDLIAKSDVVTLHLPLNNKTTHIVNKKNILKFKKGSYLINTARGGLIDTEAIILGLNKDILAGVGLDVLEEEKQLGEEAQVLTTEYDRNTRLKTLVYNHMLINHPHVLITPHNAFNSEEALKRITDTTIFNIKSFLSGRPEHTV
ncbi:hydroxyacid dehydrogenase [Candidatus Roizmanbacteria bacterium]|nr:hydroxyacid dehydrogenase [Candidatus Roizmanbacteria bacterium]